MPRLTASSIGQSVASSIDGVGTTGTIAKWTHSDSLGDSIAVENSGELQIDGDSGAGYIARRHSATATTASRLKLVRGRGSVASPAQVQVGDWLGHIQLNGYNNVPNEGVGSVIISAVATDNYTNAAAGAQLMTQIIPTGSVTRRVVQTIHQTGRHAIGIGATDTPLVPTARLHVIDPTLGDDVLNLQTESTGDDPNYRVLQGRVVTTDATPTTISTIVLDSATAYEIEVRVVSRVTATAGLLVVGDCGFVNRFAACKHQGGIAVVAQTTASVARGDISLDVDFIPSTGDILIQVTAEPDATIVHHVTVIIQSVSV